MADLRVHVLVFIAACVLRTETSAKPEERSLHNGYSDSRSAMSPRIFGGQRAKIGQFPYQACIRSFKKDNIVRVCGGSLLNERWVLSSAYCAGDAIRVEMWLGTTNINKNQPETIVLSTNFILKHPDYKEGFTAYDAALIKLNEDVEFTDNIQPIHVRLRFFDNFLGYVVLASGWGRIASNGDDHYVDDLHWTSLQVICTDKCTQVKDNEFLQKNLLCAQAINKTESICSGDYGGPLALVTKGADPVLIGVAVHGGNCTDGKPQVFLRIAKILPWIWKNIDY